MRLTLLLLAAFSLGCGSKAKAPILVPPLDSGSEAGVATTSPAPTGLPPMATMPPPGVAGSKKAKVRPDAALASCSSAAGARAKDPADLVKKLGERCGGKMKPVGSPLRGQQADKDAAQEQKFRAEANHCYRVYSASDESSKDLVVVLRDSAGDVVTQAPAPAAPEDGAVCFTASDDVSLVVGVGSGKGAWAAQVYGD